MVNISLLTPHKRGVSSKTAYNNAITLNLEVLQEINSKPASKVAILRK